jgi:hypothetical protein
MLVQRFKHDQETGNRRLPGSPSDPLQRQYHVHRRFPAKFTARLRHPQVDSTRQKAECVAARAGAWKFPSDLGAGLAAHPDRDPGWSPWPTLYIQTRMIASTAPRATSPARSPTSPGHGWPSSLPSQRLQARTASSVLTTSMPASSRPSADCTRPWPATPDDLAGLLADMKPVLVIIGGAGWRRDDRRVAAGPNTVRVTAAGPSRLSVGDTARQGELGSRRPLCRCRREDGYRGGRPQGRP